MLFLQIGARVSEDHGELNRRTQKESTHTKMHPGFIFITSQLHTYDRSLSKMAAGAARTGGMHAHAHLPPRLTTHPSILPATLLLMH